MKDEIIIAIIGSGAVFSFVQFLITLFFSRKDKTAEIEKKIDILADKVAENQAVNARTAILRFSDELRNNLPHSAEYYRQIFDDIDLYSKFCETHPGFKNTYTTIATKHIGEVYERLTREGKI